MVRRQGGQLLRPDPPDHLVIGGMAVGVLGGELRLAHATQPGERLSESRRLARGQGGPKLRQQRLPPCEVRVAWVRQAPVTRRLAQPPLLTRRCPPRIE